MNWKRAFSIQACLAWLTLLPLAMPVLVLAALWLAVPWQYAWWLVCALGILLCAAAAWRRRGALAVLSLVAGGYALSAWLVLGFDLQIEPMAGAALSEAAKADVASAVKIGASWLLAGMALILLLVGAVGLLGIAWRALRSNMPLQLRPRQLLGGMANVFICAALLTGLLVAGQAAARHQSNLQLVNSFAQSGVQLFTPVRYTREVLATTYYWRDAPATPKLASWWGIAASGYFGDSVAAHSYIRAHAHPSDKWSGAERYNPAIDTQARDEERTDVGLKLAYEPAPGPAGQALPGSAKADAAPMPTGLIINVSPGSAAALAGVQRGDTLVSIGGEPLQAMFARLDSEEKDKSKAKAESVAAAPSIAPPVLQVRSAGGKLIAITTRKPYKTTGVQAVSWHRKGGAAMAPGLHTELLYLRLDGFKQHTGVYAEKAIRESAQAVIYPPNPTWPDPAKWPDILMGAVSTLVIDLRGNPGGSIDAAGDLARRLLGSYLQPGLGLPKVQVNGDGTTSSQPKAWVEESTKKSTGLLRGLKNIMVLTSADTCSAAELLIYGLQQHLPSTVSLVTLGQATCGKPHGFNSREYFGTTVNVVDTTWLNAAKQPAYPSGIAPTCHVKDLIVGPEGGDYDLVFQAALAYVWHGKC